MTEFRHHSAPKVLSQREVPLTRSFDGPVDMQRRIWKMLQRTVARAGFVLPQDRPTVVLSLASGNGVDTPVLSGFFAGKHFGEPSDGQARVYAVEDDAAKIAKAKNDYGAADHEFVKGNATDLAGCGVPDQADVVVVRHPQYNLGLPLWTAIFGQGIQRLAPGGVVLSTSFTTGERQQTEALLRKLGCEVVVAEQNPYTREDFSGDFSYDRHVIVARRLVRC